MLPVREVDGSKVFRRGAKTARRLDLSWLIPVFTDRSNGKCPTREAPFLRLVSTLGRDHGKHLLTTQIPEMNGLAQSLINREYLNGR